ncbi:hypothetical protein [Jiulongibacter sp. NS-SX5]|uniref:hypothetical protein n=1 Tax=Jiulongibacter sp. NS-SX5 TaxID=3463854 RepID=UPI004059EE4E
MKNIFLLLICLFPFISFAQSKGDINLGVTGGGGWGQIQGFQGNIGLNAGKIISNGLVLGVNTQFHTNGYNFSGLDYPASYWHKSRNYEVTTALFAKQYLGKARFKPFFNAELGVKYRNQTGSSGQEPSQSQAIVLPHVGLGFGVAGFMGKKKNIALELGYTLTNAAKWPVFNLEMPMKSTKPISGRLNLGVQFFLK